MSKKKNQQTKAQIIKRKQKILARVLEGENKSDIITEFSEQEGVSRDLIVKNIKAVEEQITKSFSQEELLNILNLHIVRYEDFYILFRDEYKSAVMARKALRLKEDLLSIHRPEVNIQVNNNEIITEEEQYDFGKLSNQDQKRMEELLSKCRK